MSPPSATHVRVFIVVRDAEPSGAQPPTPDRGRYLHHPPITPTQVGGPHVNCRWTLWPWGCQAMAVHGGPPLGGSSQGAKHTSQGPTTDPLGKSSGKQESWCGWPGGHLSERERVGTQRTTTFTSYPHSTRWRHRTSYKYNGHQSMTWHPLILTISVAKPCQERWKWLLSYATIEVKCVKDHYLESVVWENIMQSLKGEAVDMARYMGPTTSVAHYPTKINGYFWHCGIIQHLYAKFLQSDTEQPQEGFLLCHKARRDP